MLLERIEAHSDADKEADKHGEHEQQGGDLTGLLQKDIKEKNDARLKRQLVVDGQKLTVDYEYFQMTKNRKTARPQTPDPDKKWAKRKWEQAMANWRRELRQWRSDARSEEERIE